MCLCLQNIGWVGYFVLSKQQRGGNQAKRYHSHRITGSEWGFHKVGNVSTSILFSTLLLEKADNIQWDG